jgi:hypothetical protein
VAGFNEKLTRRQSQSIVQGRIVVPKPVSALYHLLDFSLFFFFFDLALSLSPTFRVLFYPIRKNYACFMLNFGPVSSIIDYARTHTWDFSISLPFFLSYSLTTKGLCINVIISVFYSSYFVP